MSQPNFTGNIIVNLASLPDFLRKPILKKRMMEFFTLPPAERLEIINNALDGGHTIPFPNLAKLFVTWLEIIADLDEEKRSIMFSTYISEILKNPQKLIPFNLDGILEIFFSLDDFKKQTIANSIRNIVSEIPEDQKRRLFMIIPQNARALLGI
ncbi:MAG: hypothetical protein ACK4TO_05475 [Candidatus Nitrosotenuis sp.]